MENPNGQIEVYLKFIMDTKDLLASEFMALPDEDRATVLRNSDPMIRQTMLTLNLALRRASETPEIGDALSRTNQNKYVSLAAFVDMA